VKILFLSQWFQPEPFYKGISFAKALMRRGHEVEVLTGFPNYPEGKVYNGYKIKLFQHENMEGVPVLRVPLYPSHDSSAINRIANYVSFSISAAVLGSILIRKPDLIYVYHPPATIGFSAACLSVLFRAPFIYDIQDLWPDTLAATGMLNNKGILGCISLYCRLIYLRASKIIVLSPGFKKALIGRGVPESKIDVIYNWCDEDQAKSLKPDDQIKNQLGLSGKFNVVFAGTMGKAQALDAVLDVAGLLRDRYPDMQFVLIGGGVEVQRLKEEKNRLNLSNVIFIPRQPFNKIGSFLSMADVLLVHLKDDPLFRMTIPSKTQSYMAAGKPVLMAVKGDASDLINMAGNGITCEPENVDDIARCVIELYNMPRADLKEMGLNGRRYYEKNLSFEIGVEKFDRIFYSVVGKG
jgi:colanic acid biosynthesis glycosyl transferase WcaI